MKTFSQIQQIMSANGIFETDLPQRRYNVKKSRYKASEAGLRMAKNENAKAKLIEELEDLEDELLAMIADAKASKQEAINNEPIIEPIPVVVPNTAPVFEEPIKPTKEEEKDSTWSMFGF